MTKKTAKELGRHCNTHACHPVSTELLGDKVVPKSLK